VTHCAAFAFCICFCLLHCHFALQGSLWDKPMASDIQPGIETLGMPFCNPLHKPPWIFGSSCQLDSKHFMESNWVVHFYDGGELMQRLWKFVVCLWRTAGGDAFLGQASTASKLRQNGVEGLSPWCAPPNLDTVISLSSDTAISGFPAMFMAMGTSYSFPGWFSGSFSCYLMGRNQRDTEMPDPTQNVQDDTLVLLPFKMQGPDGPRILATRDLKRATKSEFIWR
jgi:hypothetical protein